MHRLLLLSCLAGVLLAEENYDGYQVWRVMPESLRELRGLKQLGDDYTLDFWKDPTRVGTPVDFLVSPEHFHFLENDLQKLGISTHEIYIRDVQSLISNQKRFDVTMKNARASAMTLDSFDYKNYHPAEKIYEWMDLVSTKHGDFVTKEQFGLTYQGRPMYVLKFEKPSSNPKPVIFVDSLIHCREWITTASLIFMFNEMLSNEKYARMLEEVDWYFVPMINIDGYVETWTGDRLWRKTKSTGYSSVCSGVDANRNWDVFWSIPDGASPNPCSSVYHGPTAVSESEIRHLSNYILSVKNRSNIDAYLSTHSYSQFILYPYNYADKPTVDDEELHTVGNLMREAIFSVHGKNYTNGPWSTTLYISTGTTTDWTYENVGIKLSYTFELRDTGKYGFLLPADQIIPTGEEYLAAMEVLSNYVGVNF